MTPAAGFDPRIARSLAGRFTDMDQISTPDLLDHLNDPAWFEATALAAVRTWVSTQGEHNVSILGIQGFAFGYLASACRDIFTNTQLSAMAYGLERGVAEVLGS
jgi:hypothetical protein